MRSKRDLLRLLSFTCPSSATTPSTSSLNVGSEASIFGLVFEWHKMLAAVFSCCNISFWYDALSSLWVSEPSLFSILGVLEAWCLSNITAIETYLSNGNDIKMSWRSTCWRRKKKNKIPCRSMMESTNLSFKVFRNLMLSSCTCIFIPIVCKSSWSFYIEQNEHKQLY